MSLELYTFEDAQGREFTSYATTNIHEARVYARKFACRLIANEYEWVESSLVEDYTEPPPPPDLDKKRRRRRGP